MPRKYDFITLFFLYLNLYTVQYYFCSHLPTNQRKTERLNQFIVSQRPRRKNTLWIWFQLFDQFCGQIKLIQCVESDIGAPYRLRLIRMIENPKNPTRSTNREVESFHKHSCWMENRFIFICQMISSSFHCFWKLYSFIQR